MDALLSLDDDAVAVRIALMEMGLAAWSATLANVPIAVARWQRMSKPIPGDYVMEITRRRQGEDYYRGFGILMPPGFYNGNAVIQYGPEPADLCTWEDADFIALPIAGATWWREAGW